MRKEYHMKMGADWLNNAKMFLFDFYTRELVKKCIHSLHFLSSLDEKCIA